MRDEMAQKAVEAYAGLPMMYVHLSLELARSTHTHGDIGRKNERRQGGRAQYASPLRENVLYLMERILALVNSGVDDVNEAPHWFGNRAVLCYREARELLGLGEYVQVMVLPCPGCDLRALVHALDAPVIRCEHCALELGLTAYEALVEQRRTGQ
jgi:hypothetical protein